MRTQLGVAHVARPITADSKDGTAMANHASKHPRPAFFVIACVLCLVAQRSATAQLRDPQAVFENEAQREDQPSDTHFGPNCIDRLFAPLKACDDRREAAGGPTFLGLYAPIWQAGTQRGSDNSTLSQSLNVYGEWELFKEPENEGTLYLFFLHESESLGTTAGEFAGAVGTTVLPNDDVGNATNALAHFGWTQKLFDGRLELAVGQLGLKLMLDQNDYAGWDRVSFIAEPLSGNPVRNFPIAAMGVDTTVHITDDLQVSMLVADADGYPFYPDFKSVGRRFVYVPGFVYTPTIPGLGKGRYEVNFSHTDRTERFNRNRSSSVWLFSFQQELSPKLAAFMRYGTGDGRRTTVQQSLSTGIVFTQVRGYNNDWFGVGFIWNDPSDGARRDDYGMETFWRLQLTENIQFTPDVQLYFDPSRNPNRNIEAALGFRLGIDF
jgi:hypothetical protein